MTASKSPALSVDELKALAMHELMKREQERYQLSIIEQRRLSTMTDAALKAIMKGAQS